jgi:DNA polymerase III subunit delta'
MFNSILGNEPIKAYFRKAIQEDRFPHALLFVGLDGIGKNLFAQELALYFLKTTPSRIENEIHPDFHVVRPEGKTGLHTIDTLRNLIDKVHSAPFESPAKFFVIHDAERMQPAAANALLKTLEEPTPDTYLILLSSSATEILPTIKSRCSVLHFQSLSILQIASLLKQKELPEKFAHLAQGSAGRAFELAQREPIEEIFFPLLAQKSPYFDQVQTLEKLEKALEDEDPVRQNRNVEHLFASIFMWYRDQHLRALGQGELFFPEAPKALQPVLSLEKISKIIDEARLAYQRNIKLSVCLEKICFC